MCRLDLVYYLYPPQPAWTILDLQHLKPSNCFKPYLSYTRKLLLTLLETNENYPPSEYFSDGPDRGRGEWKSMVIKN